MKNTLLSNCGTGFQGILGTLTLVALLMGLPARPAAAQTTTGHGGTWPGTWNAETHLQQANPDPQNLLQSLRRDVAFRRPANEIIGDSYRVQGTRVEYPAGPDIAGDILVAASNPDGRSTEIMFRLLRTPAAARKWSRHPQEPAGEANLVSRVNIGTPIYKQFPDLVLASDVFECVVVVSLDSAIVQAACTALRPGERVVVMGKARWALPSPDPAEDFNITSQLAARKERLIFDAIHQTMLGVRSLRNELPGMRAFAQGAAADVGSAQAPKGTAASAFGR